MPFGSPEAWDRILAPILGGVRDVVASETDWIARKAWTLHDPIDLAIDCFPTGDTALLRERIYARVAGALDLPASTQGDYARILRWDGDGRPAREILDALDRTIAAIDGENHRRKEDAGKP